MPKAKSFSETDEEEKTTLESQWEDEASTTVEQGEVADKIRELGVELPRRAATNITSTSGSSLEEPTVDDQHANPVISALAPDPSFRLSITQGNDAGQELQIHPGKTYTIGRGVDNDIVLTDIAVSRKHFDLRYEEGAWVIVDRGSGNGTVVNGNIEDNPFMLANGDVIEIGNTVFRFDAPQSVARPASSFEVEVDDEEMSTVAGKPMRLDPEPQPPGPAFSRPKTLPPPTPRRSQPLGYPLQPQPASTLPLPQMANRMPALAPQAPTMLGDPMMQALQPGMAPTTIPGQGPTQLPHQRYGMYPQAAEIPPHSVHAQMLVVAQQQGNRLDPSTAHVQPMQFNGLAAPMPMPRYVQPAPPLTKRTKYILGGAGLTLFAAIATVAILKSGGGGAKVDPKPASGSATTMKASAPPSKPDIQPIKVATPPDPPKPPPVLPPPPKTDPPKADPPKQIAKVDPPKADPPKADPPKADPPKADTAKADPPKQIAKADPPKQIPKVDPPKVDPPKQAKSPKNVKAPRTDPPPRRVAVVDAGDARSRANDLYRAKKFNAAADLLTATSKSVSDDNDARQLRYYADNYVRLGRNYNLGMAPSTKPTDAFDALRSAKNSDQIVGGAYDGDIETKLGQIAPKAASMYMANKEYEKAHIAVLAAQSLGASNGTVDMVRKSLESRAADMYAEASKQISSDPGPAKEKLRQIQKMVDPKSPWYAKATRLLQGG